MWLLSPEKRGNLWSLLQAEIGKGASRRKMNALAIENDPTSPIYPSSIG